MSTIRYLIIYSICLFGGEVVCGQQMRISQTGNITMSGAVSMTINNASFINNGTFTPSTSTVMFTGGSGSSNYSIGTAGLTPTTFYNLFIANTDNTVTTTVSPLVSVINTLSVTKGILNASSATAVTNGTTGNLTLLSTSTNTANVSAVTGIITGNVNVQRYLPGRRAWRLLTAPISGISTIYNGWQIGGATTSNMGIWVTGPSPTTNNGLDVGSRNNSSMKTWNYTSNPTAFNPILNTKTPISSGTGPNPGNIGYFVFVRGDRSSTFNPNATATINTTLTATGSLQTGDQTFTIPSIAATGSYVLLGNPYAAPVDFKNITNPANNSLANINNTLYTWDATLATLGGYVTFTSSDGLTFSQSTPSAQTTILQSGQAFFIKTITSGNTTSLTFKESFKSATVSPIAGFRPMTPSYTDGSLRANIYYKNEDSTIALADGNLTQFNERYNDSVIENEDASKLTNMSENFGLSRHHNLLAIESRPNLLINDTIFFNLSRTTQRAYRFQFEPNNLNNTNLIGYLQDKYLKSSTEINLSKTTPIDFSVDTSAASAAADRFQIVFKTLLPFAFTDIAGNKKNRDIAIDWKVANETDILQYELEKSIDGTIFNKVTTQNVTGSNNALNNYTWLDTKAVIGDNIYRVKMISLDGKTKYTSNVLVNMAPLTTGNFIYPNPVKNKQINLQMNNQAIGSYKLAVTNNSGQIIYSSTIQNNGNNSRFVITLNNEVASGMYNLQITNPSYKLTTQKIIVE